MKKILVPISAPVEEYILDELKSAKLQLHLKKLLSHDVRPVFVWPGISVKELKSRLEDVKGVLFVGGEDVDAKHFGEMNHPLTVLDEPGRDELELLVIEWALREKMPFLGLCRGAEILAIALGGKLIQHLPDVIDEDHGAGTDSVEKTDDIYHDVLIEPESRAAQVLGKRVVKIMSFHHKAILPDTGDFLVTGTSPSGIVEIIEGTDPSHFCFGIQGHPERTVGNEWDCFFERLSEALEPKMEDSEEVAEGATIST